MALTINDKITAAKIENEVMTRWWNDASVNNVEMADGILQETLDMSVKDMTEEQLKTKRSEIWAACKTKLKVNKTFRAAATVGREGGPNQPLDKQKHWTLTEAERRANGWDPEAEAKAAEEAAAEQQAAAEAGVAPTTEAPAEEQAEIVDPASIQKDAPEFDPGAGFTFTAVIEGAGKYDFSGEDQADALNACLQKLQALGKGKVIVKRGGKVIAAPDIQHGDTVNIGKQLSAACGEDCDSCDSGDADCGSCKRG